MNAKFLVKRDENIEPYDKQKLCDGIIRGVKNRPVTETQVTELVESTASIIDASTSDQRSDFQ